MDTNFIVIEGNIGAGKTSLVRKIGEQFNARTILEQFAKNPFLPKFYKDPDKYSFQLELSFLADRFQQLKDQLPERNLFKSFVVADYYFTKSLIFGKSTLPTDDFKLYRTIFNYIYSSVIKPDLYVYLFLKPENSKKNIQKRGRDYEQEIQLDYLEKIQSGYFDYLKQHQDFPILIIDTNEIDFVNNEVHYKKIVDLIFNTKYPKGINRVIL